MATAPSRAATAASDEPFITRRFVLSCLGNPSLHANGPLVLEWRVDLTPETELRRRVMIVCAKHYNAVNEANVEPQATLESTADSNVCCVRS
eukprot:m.121885 g.121885  ORF g.121885 m.121885 type:complete len:92 (+) comp13711_c2_seq3:2468-2743(+)